MLLVLNDEVYSLLIGELNVFSYFVFCGLWTIDWVKSTPLKKSFFIEPGVWFFWLLLDALLFRERDSTPILI